MKGPTHKILGFLLFLFLYYFKLFPPPINDYLINYVNIITSIVIVFLFSGGRLTGRTFWGWGLSPDTDFHKKMQRDWLLHSGIIPTISILVIPHPIVLVAGFFYNSHVFLDLFNTHSWEGNKYTYVAVFITVILFYVLVYSL